MPYGICLKCTNETAAPVTALWNEAEAFETAPSMRALAYPPHVTLAVYQETDPALLKDILGRVSDALPAMTLTFSSIGVFENEPLVLWAKPQPNDALLRLHAEVHRQIDPAACHQHYRPGRWAPHCTIAMNVPRAVSAAAMRWAGERRIEFSVTFDVLDCVRFPPVEILEERRLAGA
ncbi:2'-5' RNA ligase family protein [Rhizobium sp. BR 249]|uniref:2'-5' RNA ligase family protein n=1 Tax=Rhizobium sp. BR 249 TaxID=3040011 RepID=UPI0039BF39B3